MSSLGKQQFQNKYLTVADLGDARDARPHLDQKFLIFM